MLLFCQCWDVGQREMLNRAYTTDISKMLTTLREIQAATL